MWYSIDVVCTGRTQECDTSAPPLSSSSLLLTLWLFLPQDIESENVNVVKRLFKIQNINASTIRTVMVAHCRRHDNPDLVLDYEAQSQAQKQKGPVQQHQPLLFDLGTSSSDEDEEEGEQYERQESHQGPTTSRLPQSTVSSLEHVIQVRIRTTLCFVVPLDSAAAHHSVHGPKTRVKTS